MVRFPSNFGALSGCKARAQFPRYVRIDVRGPGID